MAGREPENRIMALSGDRGGIGRALDAVEIKNDATAHSDLLQARYNRRPRLGDSRALRQSGDVRLKAVHPAGFYKLPFPQPIHRTPW